VSGRLLKRKKNKNSGGTQRIGPGQHDNSLLKKKKGQWVNIMNARKTLRVETEKRKGQKMLWEAGRRVG